MKYILIIVLLIGCNERITIPSDNHMRENLPFTRVLSKFNRNRLQSKDTQHYTANSSKDLDSLEQNFKNGDFLQSTFAKFNFIDSTLIGVTLAQVFSSNSEVSIDSLVLEQDSIYIFASLLNNGVSTDISSLSDIVRIEKKHYPLAAVDVTYK